MLLNFSLLNYLLVISSIYLRSWVRKGSIPGGKGLKLLIVDERRKYFFLYFQRSKQSIPKQKVLAFWKGLNGLWHKFSI